MDRQCKTCGSIITGQDLDHGIYEFQCNCGRQWQEDLTADIQAGLEERADV